MREAVFIKQNLRKWKEYEKVIDSVEDESPDRLADIYTDLTADLAFAQTQYPKSRVTEYLNGLALLLHNSIYDGRREKWSRIKDFWLYEVPRAVYDSRKALWISLVVFLVSTAMGVISQLGDSDFARVILGDYYVDMTIRNIQSGHPTDVYNTQSQMPMFLSIAYNNIMVSFNGFVLGIFTSLMPGYYLFANGIMFGCFSFFFYQYGVFGESLLTVMQHGTLELSAIVIACGAGITMGNSWLFPGTYSRMRAFLMGAKRGMKIVIGLVPVFLVAAFIEGFFTRETGLPIAIRIAVVVISAAYIIGYFIVWPAILHRRSTKKTEQQ